MNEIKRVEAWELAGVLYRDELEAQRALARENLREFLNGLGDDLMLSELEQVDVREAMLNHLVGNFERYIALLNKFY